MCQDSHKYRQDLCGGQRSTWLMSATWGARARVSSMNGVVMTGTRVKVKYRSEVFDGGDRILGWEVDQ